MVSYLILFLSSYCHKKPISKAYDDSFEKNPMLHFIIMISTAIVLATAGCSNETSSSNQPARARTSNTAPAKNTTPSYKAGASQVADANGMTPPTFIPPESQPPTT